MSWLELKTAREFIAALRNNTPYTSIGSYPLYFAARDGTAYSFRAAKAHALELGRKFREGAPDAPVFLAINYESDIECALTDEPIERAYGAEDPEESAKEKDQSDE